MNGLRGGIANQFSNELAQAQYEQMARAAAYIGQQQNGFLGNQLRAPENNPVLLLLPQRPRA